MDLSAIQRTNIIADCFLVFHPYLLRFAPVKSKLDDFGTHSRRYRPFSSRFQKTDMIPFAVINTGFARIDFIRIYLWGWRFQL